MFGAVLSRISGDETTTRTTVSDLDVETYHDIVSNERRRQILTIIGNNAEPLTKRDIAKRMAARQTGKPRSLIDSQDYKSVYIALHQNHLPKLEEASLVDVADDDTILPTARTQDAVAEIERTAANLEGDR